MLTKPHPNTTIEMKCMAKDTRLKYKEFHPYLEMEPPYKLPSLDMSQKGKHELSILLSQYWNLLPKIKEQIKIFCVLHKLI